MISEKRRFAQFDGETRFMKTIFGTLAILAALMTSSAAADQPDISANYYLQGCREFSALQPVMSDLIGQGVCVGMLQGLHYVANVMPASESSCGPATITNRQTVTVVVQWLDRHPARWHEPFAKLALEAMHEAWPCK
jgi:hypothetical protein